MQTKKNDFFDSLIESHIRNECENHTRIENKFDTQNLNAQKWLETICVEGYKQSKDWDSEDSGYRRALKNLTKIAKDVRIESGYLLASVFFNVAVVRDKTVTEIIDGKEMEDFTRNPYDFDYEISPDTLQRTIEDAFREKKPKQVVCAVATRDANQQTPACPICEGKRFLKCEECGGTGRGEQYVADTYAGGQERMMTGKCPNCRGKGEVQCSNCNGSGKLQILSNQYQIVKKFNDDKELRAFACISTSWQETQRCYINGYNDIEYLDDFKFGCPNFGNQELQSGIEKLYKNQKEIIIDNNLTLPSEISEECSDLYEKNKKDALEFFELNRYYAEATEEELFGELIEEEYSGKVACSMEKHFAIPMFRLYYSTNVDKYGEGETKEYAIDIYKLSDKGTCCFNEMKFPNLSAFKSLFIK